MDVYDFTDYRKYLEFRISEKGRGEKSKIANAARCHIAYLSQVLTHTANLSLEQAHYLNFYFRHTEEESDFFILLVEHGRAGSAELESHFQKKIDRIQDERKLIETRLKYKKSLKLESQSIFYSHWIYLAVHMLLTIPGYRMREKISERLSLPVSTVQDVLEFLVQNGLAEEKNGEYVAGEVSIHLGRESPMIIKHHTNWKLQALQALCYRSDESVHYSSVVSIAKKDAVRIKKVIEEAIQNVRSVVSPSKEEELYCYSMDFFRV